jgi:hypothetical protein
MDRDATAVVEGGQVACGPGELVNCQGNTPTATGNGQPQVLPNANPGTAIAPAAPNSGAPQPAVAGGAKPSSATPPGSQSYTYNTKAPPIGTISPAPNGQGSVCNPGPCIPGQNYIEVNPGAAFNGEKVTYIPPMIPPSDSTSLPLPPVQPGGPTITNGWPVPSQPSQPSQPDLVTPGAPGVAQALTGVGAALYAGTLFGCGPCPLAGTAATVAGLYFAPDATSAVSGIVDEVGHLPPSTAEKTAALLGIGGETSETQGNNDVMPTGDPPPPPYRSWGAYYQNNSSRVQNTSQPTTPLPPAATLTRP